MKIRKGFVTNSSSTNFGTMLVTSLSSIGIASILNIFNVDMNAKQKSYVRLVVESPKNNTVKPGDIIPIKGQVIKIDIINGKVSGDPIVVAEATVTCVDGEVVMDTDGSNFYVTTDNNRIQAFKGSIRFEVSADYEGKRMATLVDFNLAQFYLNPQMGVFVQGMKTEQKVILSSNATITYSNDIDPSLLLTETLVDDGKTLELKLIENIEEPEKLFNKFTGTVIKKFKMRAEMGGTTLEKPYSAKLLKESILVPKQLKEPIIIKCYTEQDKAKRIDTAFELPIKVVIYDKNKNDLMTDVDLSNSLEFEFSARSGQKHITDVQAAKAVKDANLVVELVPNTGMATQQKPYAKYRIYADTLAEAETDNIDMLLSVRCNGQNIDEILLKCQLKPKIDLKGLIKQFIDYPSGTFIGSLIKLGEIDIYMNALDYVSEVKLVKTGNPRYHPGHNIIYLRRIPEGIHEFTEIQTIHHEIAHVIEEQHGDQSGTTEWDERHSYFIQYLSDVTRALSNYERGQSTDVSKAVGEAIIGFAQTYFNFANLVHPPNRGEIISWFGAHTPTQHEVFDKYLDLDLHASQFNMSEEIKTSLTKEVAKSYFPGNIIGRWKEDGGIFNGMEWKIGWSDGILNNITPQSKDYTFKELSRKWVGGSQLKIEIKYFVVRNSDKDEDEITAIFDAGSFDPSDYQFPKVNGMTIQWKPNRSFGDSILGNFIDKVIPLNRA